MTCQSWLAGWECLTVATLSHLLVGTFRERYFFVLSSSSFLLFHHVLCSTRLFSRANTSVCLQAHPPIRTHKKGTLQERRRTADKHLFNKKVTRYTTHRTMAPSPPRGLAIWSVALWTILLSLIATTVLALDESQAGVIDWYLSSLLLFSR